MTDKDLIATREPDVVYVFPRRGREVEQLIDDECDLLAREGHLYHAQWYPRGDAVECRVWWSPLARKGESA